MAIELCLDMEATSLVEAVNFLLQLFIMFTGVTGAAPPVTSNDDDDDGEARQPPTLAALTAPEKREENTTVNIH